MKRRPRHSLTELLLTYMLMVLVVSGALTVVFCALFFLLGLVPAFLMTHMGSPVMVIVMLIFFAIIVSMPLGRTRFKPISQVVEGMSRISHGDFDVRVNEEGLEGDMGELARSFNDMARELGSIELFRTDFINNFSHEFKTPIVSIRGFAKQLERDDLTEAQRREYTSIIVSESERLSNMSANVLLLSKLENQQIVTDRQPYRLDEQLRRSILLLEKQWSARELELNLQLDEVTYVGNEEMMSHVWVNLIGNAIKFSPEGGLLEVQLRQLPQGVEVTVRDQGPGMTREVQERVFEKFYQGDRSHAGQGNGLGLSLVKRIVDLCHGTVEVESAPGQGSAFRVTLPTGEDE